MAQNLAGQVDAETLPRLLYIGDVPIGNTFAGAIFFYRLLRNYPAEKLVVCAPVAGMEAPLPGVRYVAFDARWPRLLRTRFSPLYCAWISWRLNSIPRWSLELLREFRPTAVLTVSQTCGWILAWRLAQREKIPLIMYVHDDHMFYRQLPQWLWPWAQRSFADAYRYASGRFCISEPMAREYERRYGVPPDTQLAIRDPRNPVFGDPAPQTLQSKGALTFVHAGSIHGEPHLRQLLSFASAAAALGHKLVAYSPQHDALRKLAHGMRGIDVREPVPNLIEHLRNEADCLLVVGSFDPVNKDIVSTQFPSKVADYSSVGLPLIVWAPPYAAITRFVTRNGGIAELVTDADPQALAPAISRLAASPDARHSLAKAMIDAGARLFAPEHAWKSLTERLRRSTPGRNAG